RLNCCFSASCSPTAFFEYSTISRKTMLQTIVRLEGSAMSVTAAGSNAATLREAPILLYAHARLRTRIRRDEEYARSLSRIFRRCGEHHALGDAELHLARREVRHHHR